MSEIEEAIAALEADYAAHKENFERWKREHASMAGNASYNAYVEKFVGWERGVIAQMKQLRASAVSKEVPAVPLAETPMVDLETQLSEWLDRVTPAEFMMAILATAQKDAGFLPKVFEVIQRESRGTGYHHPILPQLTEAPPRAAPPASMMKPSPSAPTLINAGYHPSPPPISIATATPSIPTLLIGQSASAYGQRPPHRQMV